MSARTYIAQIAAFALGLALLVVGFNVAVDPYGITNAPRIEGFNRHKVDINNHSRLLKKYQPGFAVFDTLVVGNSRVEIGIDPAHRCFADAGMEAYNLGVPGAEVRRQLAYALNAMDGRAVDHVFLSVDFTDFIWSGRWPPEPAPPMGEVDSGDFPRFPSGAKNPRYLHSVVRDYYRSLFSLDALTSSLRTVALQSDTAPDRDARGFNPGRDYAELVRVEGPRALFDQKMDELRARYRGAWYLREGPASEFADLEWFLGLAREKGIRVTLFTNPFHREYWQLLSERGLLDLHRQWKTQLQALAARHPGAVAALWDFSLDSPYIDEPVPAADYRGPPLRWFWEPAHYRGQLGDLMIEAMLAQSCGVEPAFGERLR